MIGSLGLPEMLFILVVALLIFGPRKLPEIGRTMGKALGEFRRATSDLKRTLDVEMSEETYKKPPTAKASETVPGVVSPAEQVEAAPPATSETPVGGDEPATAAEEGSTQEVDSTKEVGSAPEAGSAPEVGSTPEAGSPAGVPRNVSLPLTTDESD